MPLFLSLPSVQGEATGTYAGQIEVTSESLGFTESRGGRPMTSPLTLTKVTDRATVPLLSALLTGKPFSTAKLTVTDSSGSARETISLTDVFVETLLPSGSQETPVESFSLVFSQSDIQVMGTSVSGGGSTPPVGGGAAPPPTLGESPLDVAVPLAGLAAAAVVLARSRRRPGTEDST